jgi:hypothetical protein
MPKCNMAVSEECRRLYGRQRGAANVQHNRYHDCIRERSRTLVLQGNPRAVRAAEAVRQRGGAAVGDPNFDALVRDNTRACRGRK